MRIKVTLQRRRRVDVAIADPHREVYGEVPFVRPDRPNDVAATNPIAGGHQPLGEVRVRRPHPAVVDGHGVVPNHNSAERHGPVPR